MRRRSLFTFVVLNVLISLGVALGVISVLDSQSSEATIQPAVQIVEVIVTATPDPDATLPVRIVTATPDPNQPNVIPLPTGLIDGNAAALDLTANPVATVDLTLAAEGDEIQGTLAALPPNCLIHTVEDGDTPFGIAEIYGVSGFDILEVNGLDDDSARFLSIGDLLVIPLEGCALSATDLFTPTPTLELLEDTPEPDATLATPTVEVITLTPTVTIPPTAVDAQVEIIDVLNAGDVTAEGVEIRNVGSAVDLAGWTLTDAQGNVFTFPEQRLFTNGMVTVFTRLGQNTPAALFWGSNTAFWEPGDVAVLADEDGSVQATFQIPNPADLS